MLKPATVLAALIVGTNSITFAATSPFSDVPADHWAYQSISKLAATNIIEGYGDKNFRGEKNLTRYEMAQMIAKAMTKNPQGSDKAELNKLIAEFRDELNALGIQVSNLENYSDKINVSGNIEFDFDYWKYTTYADNQPYKIIAKTYTVQLDTNAEINKHWSANSRIELYGDLNNDLTTDAQLIQAWVQGNYDNFQVKVGKFEFSPDGDFGLVWDTEISGAELIFGNKYKFAVTIYDR